jgi:hypothetical protein
MIDQDVFSSLVLAAALWLVLWTAFWRTSAWAKRRKQ